MPSPPLDQHLERIYQQYSLRVGFPSGWCMEVVAEVKERLGLPVVSGWFRLDQRFFDWGCFQWKYYIKWHCWNSDPQGRIIDLTASQFNEGLKRKNRIPAGVQMISQEEPFYRRYLLRGVEAIDGRGGYKIIERERRVGS